MVILNDTCGGVCLPVRGKVWMSLCIFAALMEIGESQILPSDGPGLMASVAPLTLKV